MVLVVKSLLLLPFEVSFKLLLLLFLHSSFEMRAAFALKLFAFVAVKFID